MAVNQYTDAFIADPLGAGWPDAPTDRIVDLATLERDRSAPVGFGLVDGGGAINVADDVFEETVLATANVDGDRQAATRRRSRWLEVPLVYRGLTGQAIQDLRSLASAVAGGGILVLHYEGHDEPEFWDFYDSPFAEALTGTPRDLYRLTRLLQNERGWRLRLKCYPWPRSAAITLDAQTVTNDVDLRHINVSNPGNVPSECRLEVTLAGGTIAELRYGIRDEGNLTEYAEKYSHPLSTATLKVDTSAVAVTDAHNDEAAVVDFSTDEGMARRVRLSFTLDDSTAMDRLHKMILRYKARGGTAGTSRFKIQPRYGFTADDLVMQARDRIEFDWRDVDTPNFIESNLGNIKVPVGATRIIIEIWAARLSGDQNLALDMLTLMPCIRQFTKVGTPGWRMGQWGHEKFDADELDGTGALRRGTYRLNDTGEVAFPITPGDNGFQLPAGIHHVGVEAMLREYEDNAITSGPNPPSIVLGELQVIEEWTSNVRKRIKLRTKDDRLWTRRNREVTFAVTSAEAAANRKFIYQVEFTAAPAAGRAIRVEAFTHRFLEALSTDIALVIDSKIRRCYGMDTSNGATVFSCIHENDLPLCPPGDSVWPFALYDPPADPGYLDLDRREPTARCERDREASIVVKIWPRHSH